MRLLQGFIIAFTSDFIPHLVYATVVSPNHSLDGFLEFSLSVFNTSDLEPGSEPYNSSYSDVKVCRSVCMFVHIDTYMFDFWSLSNIKCSK